MRFSTCRPGKTNGNFITVFSTRDDVSKTYKHTKFTNLVVIGSQGRHHTVVKCKGFVTSVLPFIRFLISPTGLDRFPRLQAQTTCSVSHTCLWEGGFGAFKLIFKGFPAQKNSKISTRFWTADLQRKLLRH